MRWLVKKTNPEYIAYLSHAASVSPVFAQVLINRGLRTASEVSDFISPGPTGFSDPFDLPDMQKAVSRIKAALAGNETVLVHGDYDTDGLTAAAIMVLALRKAGLEVHPFIPSRSLHGYGFNPPAVSLAKKIGATLIITVDCGINASEAVGAARAAGIDVIITDHHEPQRRPEAQPGVHQQNSREEGIFVLPDAVAVVNPKITPLNDRIQGLSGAGVAFKVAQALAIEKEIPFDTDDSYSLLDLAALGTVADVVPLSGENRIIVREGLKRIQSGSRVCIQSLKEVAGLRDREIRAANLAFTLVPRINAAGRMADAGEVMRLFLSSSSAETLDLGRRLDTLNTERQRVEEEVFQEAVAMLHDGPSDAPIVLAGKGWHPGVLGIVASRMAEQHYRPAFIFSLEDGIAKGSARSIPPFDLCSGLEQCRDVLLAFGGHKQAAGLKLKEGDLPAFAEAMQRVLGARLNEEDFVRTLEIDAGVSLRDISHSLVKELAMLEPLGYGNPEPLLGAKTLGVEAPRIVGNNHLKVKLRSRSHAVDAIGFDMGDLLDSLGDAAAVDAAFVPAINDWNGGRYLQLILRALRTSS